MSAGLSLSTPFVFASIACKKLDGSTKGNLVMQLRNVRTVTRDGGDKKKFTIESKVMKNSWVLTCKNESDREKWFVAFKALIACFRERPDLLIKH